MEENAYGSSVYSPYYTGSDLKGYASSQDGLRGTHNQSAPAASYSPYGNAVPNSHAQRRGDAPTSQQHTHPGYEAENYHRYASQDRYMAAPSSNAQPYGHQWNETLPHQQRPSSAMDQVQNLGYMNHAGAQRSSPQLAASNNSPYAHMYGTSNSLYAAPLHTRVDHAQTSGTTYSPALAHSQHSHYEVSEQHRQPQSTAGQSSWSVSKSNTANRNTQQNSIAGSQSPHPPMPAPRTQHQRSASRTGNAIGAPVASSAVPQVPPLAPNTYVEGEEAHSSPDAHRPAQSSPYTSKAPQQTLSHELSSATVDPRHLTKSPEFQSSKRYQAQGTVEAPSSRADPAKSPSISSKEYSSTSEVSKAQMRNEMRAMFEKIREYRTQDPALYLEALEQIRQVRLAKLLAKNYSLIYRVKTNHQLSM